MLAVCQVLVDGSGIQHHRCIAEEADAAQRSNAGGHGKAAASEPAPRQRLPTLLLHWLYVICWMYVGCLPGAC